MEQFATRCTTHEAVIASHTRWGYQDPWCHPRPAGAIERPHTTNESGKGDGAC